MCDICGGPCLIKPDKVPKRGGIATHQPIIPLDELRKCGAPFELISGPDTLLATWQFYHQQKMWTEADLVRVHGLALGLTPVFALDHYEVHH